MNNPHEKNFNLWRDRLHYHLRCKRGRASELSRYLGVTRQSVWRYYIERHTHIPGWIAAASIAWYFKQVSPDQDRALRNQQVAGLLKAPEHFQLAVTTQADSLSADPRTNVYGVSGQ